MAAGAVIITSPELQSVGSWIVCSLPGSCVPRLDVTGSDIISDIFTTVIEMLYILCSQLKQEHESGSRASYCPEGEWIVSPPLLWCYHGLFEIAFLFLAAFLHSWCTLHHPCLWDPNLEWAKACLQWVASNPIASSNTGAGLTADIWSEKYWWEILDSHLKIKVEQFDVYLDQNDCCLMMCAHLATLCKKYWAWPHQRHL